MSDLDLGAAEAAAWFDDQAPPGAQAGFLNLASRDRRPRLHLVLGDSVARKAEISSRFRGDEVLNRARGGATWSSLSDDVDASLGAWELAAAAKGLLTGSVIIWLTGNDVYSKLSNMSSFDRSGLEHIGHTARAVVRRIQRRADFVLLFGPLPRLAGELDGVAWEATAAYHLERTLKREVVEERSILIPMGRALTRKISRNRHGLKNCEAWFKRDRVHLTAEGYRKIADSNALPVWLTLAKLH